MLDTFPQNSEWYKNLTKSYKEQQKEIGRKPAKSNKANNKTEESSLKCYVNKKGGREEIKGKQGKEENGRIYEGYTHQEKEENQEKSIKEQKEGRTIYRGYIHDDEEQDSYEDASEYDRQADFDQFGSLMQKDDIRENFSVYKIRERREKAKERDHIEKPNIPTDVLGLYADICQKSIYAPQSLVTHITKAWESKEWSNHPWITSPKTGKKNHKSSSNLQSFIQIVAHVWNMSLYNEGKLYVTALDDIFSENSDQIEMFLDLLTRKWNSKHETYKDIALATLRRPTDKHPWSIRWNPFPFEHSQILLDLNDRKIVKAINRYRRRKLNESLSNAICIGEMVRWAELEKPKSWDEICEAIDWRKLLKDKNPDKAYEPTQEAIDLHKKDYKSKWDYWSCAPCYYTNNHDRHYSPSIMLPSAIRVLLKYKGKPLQWIDVASMHPVIIFEHYLKICIDENERAIINDIISSENPREELFRKLNCSDAIPLDDEISKSGETIIGFKRTFLKWINAPVSTTQNMPLNNFMKSILNRFVIFMESVKKTFGHRCMSRYLLAREADIMEPALIECWSRNIMAIGAHDGIDCESDCESEVMEIITDQFRLIGLPCNLTNKQRKVK